MSGTGKLIFSVGFIKSFKLGLNKSCILEAFKSLLQDFYDSKVTPNKFGACPQKLFWLM